MTTPQLRILRGTKRCTIQAGVMVSLLVLSCEGTTDVSQQAQRAVNIESDLARFVDGDRSLQELIEFPDIDDDVAAIVYCRTLILEDGQIYGNVCFPSKIVNKSFKIAVETAIRSAKATPAIVDGKPYITRIFYRVIFFQKDGVAETVVFSNWGTDVDRLGNNYEAPQRYTYPTFPPGCYRFWPTRALTTTMLIGTDGSLVSDVEIETSHLAPTRTCFRSIRDLYKKSKFIPGRLNGLPVKASLVEIFGVAEDMWASDD